MLIADAQREVRSAFLGGFVGGIVSGLLWLASAALATWSTPRLAILLLVFGGMFIFPLTQWGSRRIGRAGHLNPGNALNGLGTQVGIMIPLLLPVVGAAALYRFEWFYPALMVVVGAHYLPFAFLYGMRGYFLLGMLLIAAGLGIGLRPRPLVFEGGYLRDLDPLGAWVTGAILIAWAFVARAHVLAEERAGGRGQTWPLRRTGPRGR